MEITEYLDGSKEFSFNGINIYFDFFENRLDENEIHLRLKGSLDSIAILTGGSVKLFLKAANASAIKQGEA